MFPSTCGGIHHVTSDFCSRLSFRATFMMGSQKDLEQSLARTRPSVNLDDIKNYEKFTADFGQEGWYIFYWWVLTCFILLYCGVGSWGWEERAGDGRDGLWNYCIGLSENLAHLHSRQRSIKFFFSSGIFRRWPSVSSTFMAVAAVNWMLIVSWPQRILKIFNKETKKNDDSRATTFWGQQPRWWGGGREKQMLWPYVS